MKIDIAYTPALFTRPENTVVVVIDVLRATTSIAVLLARGVPAIYPASSITEAVALREQLGAALLCGEVEGRPPEGFDHGNSPVEFSNISLPPTPLPVVMATTNGTSALLAAREAPLVLAGALVNSGAVVDAALAAAREGGLDVTFLCAGTKSRVSQDDVYTAAVLAARLATEAERLGMSIERTDAVGMATQVGRSYNWVAGRALRESEHGRMTTELGYGDDVTFAALADRYDVAPRLVLTDDLPRLVAR